MRKILQLILVLSLAFGIPQIVGALPLTVNSSSGSLLASATFDTGLVNGQTRLIVTLTNTSTADVLVPTDVLTAVFFDISGNPALTRVSAVLGSGSSVLFNPPPPGNVVGGEWAYKSGLSGAPFGASYGISSTGVDLFGPPDRFPGSNLQGPQNVGGLEYGITSAGDLPDTGNTPVTGGFALIKNSVVFTLGGLINDFDPSVSISKVSFLYGTDLATVPEPATMFLLGFGLIGMAMFARRRFKK